MVNVALSFAAMAAVVTMVAIASPCSPNRMTPFSRVFRRPPSESTILSISRAASLGVSSLRTLNPTCSLVGGINGDKSFQQLEFCIVSTDLGCVADMPSYCIYENVEYRFRVNGPIKGYLKIIGNHVVIVDNFADASGLNLYKEEGWGLRVAHLHYGSRSVFATNGGGSAVTLETQRTGDARQWFRIIPSQEVNQEPLQAPAAPTQCVPETSIKEYHPFELKSSKLNSIISKKIQSNLIVGGVNGNKNYEQLEMCIVSSGYGCDKTIKSHCIYQNVEYRFRVNKPVKGYIKIVGDEMDIVQDFYDASPLNLYKEAGWGLRIAHTKSDGSRSVWATNGGGSPVTLEPVRSNDARQWFQIMESNSFDEKPYPRF
ncbi:hypothetical protein BGX28_003636 [Mortierella sp. GBA30]|nr:hypothetical protein BGX28_003636 [Mortierella sp. GBA30]